MSKCSKCGADTELHDGGVPICVKCSERGKDRQRIMEILHRNLQVARQRRDEASTHFNDMTRHTPSGIPYPDSQERLHIASRDYTNAQQALAKALAQLNDYLIDGEVPPGLEDR